VAGMAASHGTEKLLGDCRQPVKSCSRGFFNTSDRFLNTFPCTKSSWRHRGAIFLHAMTRTAALDDGPACLATPKSKFWPLAPPAPLLLLGSGQEQSQPTRPGAPWHFPLLQKRFTDSSRALRKPKASAFLAPRCFSVGRHGLPEQQWPCCSRGRVQSSPCRAAPGATAPERSCLHA